jgi:predicted DNA-binding transcriptional regulator YafY
VTAHNKDKNNQISQADLDVLNEAVNDNLRIDCRYFSAQHPGQRRQMTVIGWAIDKRTNTISKKQIVAKYQNYVQHRSLLT